MLELVCGQMEAHCKAHRITFEKTALESLPQNGVAEHANCMIYSMAHVMLTDANLCDFFWPFTVLAATHIKQRVPYTLLPLNTIPFELWYNHRPDLFYL
jgi:hypothetical protein